MTDLGRGALLPPAGLHAGPAGVVEPLRHLQRKQEQSARQQEGEPEEQQRRQDPGLAEIHQPAPRPGERIPHRVETSHRGEGNLIGVQILLVQAHRVHEVAGLRAHDGEDRAHGAQHLGHPPGREDPRHAHHQQTAGPRRGERQHRRGRSPPSGNTGSCSPPAAPSPNRTGRPNSAINPKLGRIA